MVNCVRHGELAHEEASKTVHVNGVHAFGKDRVSNDSQNKQAIHGKRPDTRREWETSKGRCHQGAGRDEHKALMEFRFCPRQGIVLVGPLHNPFRLVPKDVHLTAGGIHVRVLASRHVFDKSDAVRPDSDGLPTRLPTHTDTNISSPGNTLKVGST